MIKVAKSLLGSVLTLGLCVGAFFKATPSVAQEVTSSGAKSVTVPIQGMSCGSCVANVKRTLKAIDGVKEVEVSLEKKQARIEFDAGKVNADRLTKAIGEAGYKPGTPVGEAK
jgi:copper ion binding protein